MNGKVSSSFFIFLFFAAAADVTELICTCTSSILGRNSLRRKLSRKLAHVQEMAAQYTKFT